jgi:toxin FitB
LFILDTNVISELMKAAPAESVMRWMTASSATDLYTTSITQAEILYGIMLLPAGKLRTAFETAASEMFAHNFAGRVLSFGSDAAHLYARIASIRSQAGHPISTLDAQIAAIAFSAGAAIVTRNTNDFADCGVKVVNPWISRPQAPGL